VLKGVKDIWGPDGRLSDLQTRGGSLPADCTPLVLGATAHGPKARRTRSIPRLIALPVAWVKTWTGNAREGRACFPHHHGKRGRLPERRPPGRLTANAAYWCLRMEEERIDPGFERRKSSALTSRWEAASTTLDSRSCRTRPSFLQIEGVRRLLSFIQGVLATGTIRRNQWTLRRRRRVKVKLVHGVEFGP